MAEENDTIQSLPTIDEQTGHWVINGLDTGISARGEDGAPGDNGTDGLTPHIDSITNRWFVGNEDTGVSAKGIKGDSAVSFKIGQVSVGEPTVTNVGTPQDVVLDFVLPAGRNGNNGTNGKSAYELAAADGYEGTEQAWLDSLKGKSAYELAVEEGSPLSQNEWLASLKGEKGDKGDSAITIAIGSVKTGTETTVANSGTGTDVILDFTFKPTDLQGLASYATKNELANKQDKQDMASYYDAKSVDELLANKADVQSVANVANKADVQQLKFTNDTLTNRIDELNAKVSDLTTRLVAVEQQLKNQSTTTNK